MKPARRISNLRVSTIAVMKKEADQLAAKGHTIIDLAMGRASHAVSQSARDAMHQHIDGGELSYGTPFGNNDLRVAAATYLNDVYNLPESLRYSRDNVVVAEGSALGIALCQFYALNPGDKAMFIAPAYSSYAPVVVLADGDYVVSKTSKHDGFQPDIEDMRRLFMENEFRDEDGVLTNRIKTILLNYPNNPTSATLSPEKTREMAAFLDEMHARYNQCFLVMLDESYMGFEKEHASILQCPISEGLRKDTVVLGSASKFSAMMGARCGFVVAHKDHADLLSKVNGALVLSANTIAQEGLLADLRLIAMENASHLERQAELIEYYGAKARYVAERLNQIGEKARWGAAKTPVPILQEGLFVFADLSGMLERPIPEAFREEMGKDTIEDDVDIAKYHLLISKEPGNPDAVGVAMVPGSGFFFEPKQGFVRICVAGMHEKPLAQDTDLKRALDAMERAALLQMPERSRRTEPDRIQR